MRRYLTIALLAAVAFTARAQDPPADPREAEARALAAAFVGQLKPRLEQALAEGGPGHAIEVCASAAPAIADALSAGSGWSVKRVSLKSRNASRAQPDDWERGVLEQFDRRQAGGEAPAGIRHAETVRGRYRYLQAQGVEPVCLVCHGENLSGPVREALALWYPDDAATGYTLGQVRGAISLSQAEPER
jgi:hypothetical protein